jgi:hypothetical protein
VLRKKPRDLASHRFSSFTTLPPKGQGGKQFEIAPRSGVLLGSFRKLTLCGGSVNATLLSTTWDRLGFGF